MNEEKRLLSSVPGYSPLLSIISAARLVLDVKARQQAGWRSVLRTTSRRKVKIMLFGKLSFFPSIFFRMANRYASQHSPLWRYVPCCVSALILLNLCGRSSRARSSDWGLFCGLNDTHDTSQNSAVFGASRDVDCSRARDLELLEGIQSAIQNQDEMIEMFACMQGVRGFCWI